MVPMVDTPFGLDGQIAVVTGATRGVGKGIALALADAGALVYLTGRTATAGAGQLRGSLNETEDAIRARGGSAISVQVDHRDDETVRALFDRISREQGRLDILVNNVFWLPDGPLFETPFWEQSVDIWDAMHSVGLRSHYVASALAAPLMVKR